MAALMFALKGVEVKEEAITTKFTQDKTTEETTLYEYQTN